MRFNKYFADIDMIGRGFVIKNSTTTISWTHMQTKDAIWSLKVAEAAALLEAIQWVLSFGYQKVIRIWSCMRLKEWKKISQSLMIMRMCRALFWGWESFNFHFVRRERNVVAHELV